MKEPHLTEGLQALGICPGVQPPAHRLGARARADLHVTLEERPVRRRCLEHGENGGHSDAPGVVVGKLRYEFLGPTGPGGRWSFRYEYGNKWASSLLQMAAMDLNPSKWDIGAAEPRAHFYCQARPKLIYTFTNFGLKIFEI